MHPHLKSLLVKAGCSDTATDDEAQSFYDGMSADKKAEIDGKLAKMMESEEDGLSGSPPPPGVPTDVPATLSAKQIADVAQQAAMAAVQAVLKTNADPAAVGRLSAQAGASRISNAQAQPAVDDDDAALQAESKRVDRIRKLGALHRLSDADVNVILSEGGSFEDCRTKMLRKVHEASKPLANVISVGEDKRIASLRAALPQAMLMRAGNDVKKMEKHGEKVHEEAFKFREQPVLDMFRTYLVSLGVPAMDVFSLSRTALAASLGPRALRARFPRIAALAESTSDFGNITLDAINKALRFNYLDAKRTWPIWAEKKFAPDFKTINSIALSEAPNMVSSNEAGEIQYVALTDSKETGKLVTYKAGIKLTRNAIINDDLDAFNAIPRLQANAAARLEDDTAYKMITTNAAMADTGLLFNATATTTAGGHANNTTSGGAPSVTNLQIGKTLMKKQKGLANAARLELEPKFLLVPTSIEESTKEFIGSQKLIASQSSSGSAPLTVGDSNPFFNRYEVVGSTRLDDNSATAWYLLADYREGQIGTFQLYFLTDEPEPVLRQETDFDTEDVKYLVRHTCAGLVPDFRGAYRNNGA